MKSASGLLDYDEGLLKVIEGDAPQVQIITLNQLQPAIERMMNDSAVLQRVLACQEQAYRAISAGEVSIMPIQTVGQPPFANLTAGKDAQVCVKTGYLKGDTHFVAKVAGGGGDHGGNTGMLLLFSQKTLKLEKMLMDEGILTEIRTAAASVLATSKLLHKDIEVDSVGFYGSGIQAIWQLRFLNMFFKQRRPGSKLPDVFIKSRSSESASRFIEKMKTSHCALDCEWKLLPMSQESLRKCQLIHTCTCNRNTPLFKLDDLSPHVHITAVGTDSPGKIELELDVIEAATLRVTDSYNQAVERGEFQHWCKEKSIKNGEELKKSGLVIEFGDWLSKPEADRFRPTKRSKLDSGDGATLSPWETGISIFDTSGVAAQDVAIAQLAASLL
eukprot:TRINITY_DN92356_c0_g1_i1.p1 TRINITY_DN92356_c0_g1~~TRINITY_DN92356_c0_g1_i1.p1  ORF type:complete len:387 (-),score=82.79 TRINITY_DN92356_c0_g1_i1:9-1169(-)